MFPITHSTVQRVFGDGVVVLYPHVQLGQRVLTSGSTVILRFFAALSTRRILRIALKTVVYRIFSGFFLIPVVVAGDPVCANVVLSHLLALDAYSFLFLAATRINQIISIANQKGKIVLYNSNLLTAPRLIVLEVDEGL